MLYLPVIKRYRILVCWLIADATEILKVAKMG